MVGSFLNVCIYRLPRGESVVWPASRCPRCGRRSPGSRTSRSSATLALRGRCRDVPRADSIRYPIVEALTGADVRVRVAGTTARACCWRRGWCFGCALIVLFAIDLEHQLLPNAITLPGIVVGFAFSLFAEPGWIGSLIGMLVGGGVLFVIAEAYYRLRHEEGLGMGDVKMLAMIGAFLGWKLDARDADAGVVRRLGHRRRADRAARAAA